MGQWDPIKKTRLLHLETSKNHLIRNFLRNGHLRVKSILYFFRIAKPRLLLLLTLYVQNTDGSYCIGALIDKFKAVFKNCSSIQPVESSITVGFDTEDMNTQGQFLALVQKFLWDIFVKF